MCDYCECIHFFVMLLQKFWQERWHIAVLSASQTFQKVTFENSEHKNFKLQELIFADKKCSKNKNRQ